MYPFRICSIAALLAFTAAVAQPAAIKVNFDCEVGNCSKPGALSNGQSIAPTPFFFTYTFSDGDVYDLAGTYAASYSSANGSSIRFGLLVGYAGLTPSKGNDQLSVDLLQNYFDNSPGTFDGTYSESVPLTLSGSGTSVTAQLSYDGKSVGYLGRYYGPGSYDPQASSYLSGLTGNRLFADYNFNVYFAEGAQLGSYVYSPFTLQVPESDVESVDLAPEPTHLLLAGGGLVALACFLKRRRPGVAR